MRLRPRSLEATVALYAFLFEAALLLASFAAIDFLLWRSLRGELRRAAGEELEGLSRFVVDHEAGGEDYLLDEMTEHLRSRAGVAMEVRKGGEPLFQSTNLSGGERPVENGRFLETPQGVFWIEGGSVRGFDLRVGVSAGEAIRARGKWRAVMGLCLVGGLAVAALLARVLARQATAPLAAIGTAAERIDEENLSERLPRAERRYDEVERVCRSFDQMVERLELAVRKLRQFTADASHELRTPLAVLKVQAQAALASAALEPDADALIRSQLEEIDRLSAMVEDLLTVTRLDTPWPALSAVDVADVVLETVEPFRSIADVKGIDFAVTDLAPAVVMGERSQLRRMVTNLVDNALEYTERGGCVRIALHPDRTTVRLEVRDTGQGISAADLGRIFERFYRADPSRSRRSGGRGVGLGLAIVARIVEFHRGEISVSSEREKGSSFIVELPLADGASCAPPTSPS